MTAKGTYKVLTAVGEQTSRGNGAFEQLETFVNQHISEGWKPSGGIAVTSIVGPKTAGSTKENWLLRVAQAMIRDTDV